MNATTNKATKIGKGEYTYFGYEISQTKGKWHIHGNDQAFKTLANAMTYINDVMNQEAQADKEAEKEASAKKRGVKRETSNPAPKDEIETLVVSELRRFGLRIYVDGPNPDGREGNMVFVEAVCDPDKYTASYACATNEGELADDYQMTPAQLNWLNGETIQNWLALVNY